MPVDKELAYEIVGNAGDTVVFVHGWPDDYRLWQQQVDALKSRFRCVLVTLPNFGELADKPGGYNFPTLVDMLDRTIERVQGDAGPVALVTHDWGAYIGYMFDQARPDKVRKMVALDIGAHVQPATMKEALFMMGYQWTLIGCWLIGGVLPPAGNWLSRKFAGALGVPQPQASRVHSRSNYPYFYLWSAVLIPWLRKNLLQRYTPQCPILFIYGGNKPLMFHSERWLKIVEQTSGRNERIEGAGHWFMESHADQINQLIGAWLDDNQGQDDDTAG